MEIGEKEDDQRLDEVLKTVAVNECCTLVYTVSISTFVAPPQLCYSQNVFSQVQWEILRVPC